MSAGAGQLGRGRLASLGRRQFGWPAWLLALAVTGATAVAAGFWLSGARYSLEVRLGLWTIVVGAICNVACALLGCFLVLRRLSLLGDAISHAVLPGIALAFFLSGQISGLPIVAGAMLIGVLTAFLTQSLHSFGKIPEDASMGVAFTSLFALGVIMINRGAAHADLDPNCVLYGLIEFVPLDTVPLAGVEVPRTLITLGPTLLVTLVFVALLWKELKLVAFDPALATAMGISAALVHYLLMAMVAGVAVASFEAVGSILVVAMLIVPGATAHLLTDRLGWMLAWAVLVAALSAVLGYLAAAWLNTSVAGMMAVVAGAQFTLAVFFAPRHGVLSKLARNWALSLRIVSEDIMATLYRAEEAALGAAGEEPASRAGGRGLVGWLAAGRLWHEGRLRAAGRGRLALTDRGRRAARSIVRSHRLWEAYLDQHFDLPRDHLHEPAERMEHFIDTELQHALESELSTPDLDPHGRSIPRNGGA